MDINILLSYIHGALGGDSGLSFFALMCIFLFTLFLSFYIFVIYKYAHRSSFYCQNTNIMIASICSITCILTISLQTSYLVFVGIIGSLSMVRLRTSLKNPLDILYILWSLTCGILCGANQIKYAFLTCLIITFALMFINALFLFQQKYVLTLKIPTANYKHDEILHLLNKHSYNITLKYYHERGDLTQLTFLLKTKQRQNLVSDLSTLSPISICLLELDCDFRR